MKKPILVLIFIACSQLDCMVQSSAEFKHNNSQCNANSCEQGYSCVNSRCLKNCNAQNYCSSNMLCSAQGYCIIKPITNSSTITEDDFNPANIRYEVSPPKKEVFIENRKAVGIQFVLNEIHGSQKNAVTNTIWKVEPKGEISIESDGWIYLDGTVAGNFTISAYAPDMKGSAQLSIKTTEQILADGVSSDAAGFFPAGNPLESVTAQYSGTITSAYPDDNVLLPRNISPTLFQWNAAHEVTLYRLIVGGSVSVISLLTRSTEAKFSKETWSVLANSERNIPLQWMVEGVSESQTSILFSSSKHTITFSNDRLQGAIYYWSVDTENIMKFRMGEDSPKPLFDKSAFPEIPQRTKNNVKCAGCHTIAPDGSSMALTFEGGNYDGRRTGIINVEAPYSPLIDPAEAKFYSRFQSFSPDSKYLAINADTYNNIDIIEVSTANFMSNVVTGPATQPKWSADGKMIAYIKIRSQQTGDVIEDEAYNRSDVHLAMLSGLQSVDDTLLVSGGNEAVSDPDFSPDSKTIIFRRAPTGSIRETNAKLFLYSLESQTEIALANLANNSNPNDFWPSFSPFPENDYYWVLFFSRRKYGNTLGEGQKQLWIAPIDKQVIAGKDPSHPAFWLYGQDINTGNMKGQWVPDYCLTDGEHCDQAGLGKTCCEGLACKLEGMPDTADQETIYSCQYPTPPCVDKGNPCESGGSIACCNGFLCKISEGSMDKPLCVPPPPPCLEKDEICTLDGVSKCCEPHTCQATQMSDTDLYNIERKCM